MNTIPLQPTKVFYNASIITLDPARPRAEAIVLADDKVLALGENAEMLAQVSPSVPRVDLAGQVVVPGFNDSHMHLLSWGQGMDDLDLAAAESSEEIIHLAQSFAEKHPRREWILGRGFNDDRFPDKRLPNKDDLDKISQAKPVVLTRVCGHICVVNTVALSLARINSNTVDPGGGSIDRGPDGKPTGILRENAMALVKRLIPSPSKEDLKRCLQKASRAAASLGLTTVQSNDLVGAEALDTTFAVYRELAQEGSLPLRVQLQVSMPTLEELESYLEVRRYYPNLGSYLNLGPLKLFADGSLGARTAALSKPYTDAPEIQGLPLYTQRELDELITKAAEANIQTAVHAIGDGAMEMVLNSYERIKLAIPSWTRRPRIIHCQITTAKQLKRMAALNIVADIQPIFVPTDLHFVEQRVGSKRARSSYAWKTMHRLGIRTAGGSDCPVESCNPLWGLHAAITRQDHLGYPPQGWQAGECLTPSEALALFTTGPAYAAHEEHLKGTLSPGKLADFTVLPFDPGKVTAEELLYMSVSATYVGGNAVFKRS